MSVSTKVRRPDIEAVFQHLSTLFTAPDLPEDPIASFREATVRYPNVGVRPSLDGVDFTPADIAGVPGEWVTTPGSSSAHRILYVHGGGWGAGSAHAYRLFSAALARSTGLAILMVDYRLAPENHFPAALDDCVTALRWIEDNGPAGPEKALSVALGGDSAGSNIAAAICALTIEAHGRVPDKLVLIGPAMDAVDNPDRIGRDDDIVTPDTISKAFGMYMADDIGPTDPRVSPIYTAEETLRQFPPTLIQVSGAEAWIFDARAFTRRLEDAEVRVVLSIWPHMPHVWHFFLDRLPEANQAFRELGDFLAPDAQ